MDYSASAYTSLLMTITAVFLLITAQFGVTSAELRVSRMHERYNGCYDSGIAAAEARLRVLNNAVLDAENDILREYVGRTDWTDHCELRGGVLVLTGEAFWPAYQEIAQKYLPGPYNETVTMTQESGMDIDINSNFDSPGTLFTITVTNNSRQPAVKNMDANVVKIQGQIIWNPDPPVYTLSPNFNMSGDTLDGKSIDDFQVIRDADFEPFVLFGVHRV